MPQAVLAVAAAVGSEYIAAATVAGHVFSWSTVALNAALGVGLSFVSESLQEKPQAALPAASSEIANRKQLIRTSAGPRRAIYGWARVSGNLVYIANGTDKAYVHMVIALAGHSCEAVDGTWLGEEMLPALDAGGDVTTGRFAGHVRVRFYLGAQTAGDADLAAECPDWAAKPRVGHGVSWVYLRIKRSRDVFPQGIPTPRFDVRGKNDILDVRTGLRGHTSNAALCTLDWICWRHGYGSSLDEVHEDSWRAAANVSDEAVAIPGGGTERRYEINGSFTLDRGRREVLDAMRSAMAGMASYLQGQWYGAAGAADAAVMDIDEGDLRGPYEISPRVPDNELFNGVRGTFVETAYWTETDFPPVGNPLYVAQDNGEEEWKDVKYEFEISPYRAQRLARIMLERHRQSFVVKWPMRIRGIRLRHWNIVRLTIPKMGWDHKLFRVIDYKLNPVAGPDLVLEEYAPSIYTMPADELVTVDPAPDTNLQSPFTVDAPGPLSLTSGTPELLKLADGTVISRIRAAWPAPDDPYVRRGELQYRAVDEVEWQAGPPVDDALACRAFVGPLIDGVAYEVRLRLENALGVRSEWTTSNPHTVVGKRERPANVASFVIDGKVLRWPAVADIDLDGYLLRWQPGANRSFGDANPLHDGLVFASPYTMLNRPSGPVTLMIKAVDTSGNESLDAAYIVTDFGDPLVANVVATSDFHSDGFAGTQINATIDGGTGDLIATVDVEPVAWTNDLAAAWTRNSDPAWDDVTYKAMTYVDRVTVAAVDAGAQMTVVHAISAANYAIDYRRDGLVAAWTDDADPAWTDDADPAWDVEPWQAWPGTIAAEAGAYEFRVSTAAGNVRGRISSLAISLDVPDIQETLADITLEAGGSRLPISRAYRAVTAVHLTLQHGGGTARRVEVMDKNATLGPLVQGFDSTDTGAAALVDATIQGY